MMPSRQIPGHAALLRPMVVEAILSSLAILHQQGRGSVRFCEHSSSGFVVPLLLGSALMIPERKIGKCRRCSPCPNGMDACAAWAYETRHPCEGVAPMTSRSEPAGSAASAAVAQVIEPRIFERVKGF